MVASICIQHGFVYGIPGNSAWWFLCGADHPTCCGRGLNWVAESVVVTGELYLLDASECIFEHDAVSGDEVGDDAGEEHLESGQQ